MSAVPRKRPVRGAFPGCAAIGVALAAVACFASPVVSGSAEFTHQPTRADRHPIISEVLFSVPLDADDPLVGDANLDGSRDAIGDEFVELFNPHDVAIQLRGYTIVDGHPPTRNRWRFTFPAFTLGPGEVVVVFNGLEQTWRDEPGNARRAPAARDPRLGGWVFTSENRARAVGLANAGDWVLLSAPGGRALEAVVWGEPGVSPPAGTGRVFEVPATRTGSVRRTSDGQDFEVHPVVDEPARAGGRRPGRDPVQAPDRGVPYSPGRHPG